MYAGIVAANPRYVAFALSMCLHVGGLASLVWLDSALAPQGTRLQSYRVVMLPKEQPRNAKVLWYNFRTSIPEIAPDRPFGPASKPQGKRTRPAGR